MASYLPLADEKLRVWTSVFAAGILDQEGVYGLSTQEVGAYIALQEDYTAKLAASLDPATRGSARTLAKNTVKRQLVKESRRLAMAVTNHPGVTDQQRHDLGLRIKDVEPTPIARPTEMVKLSVSDVEGRLFTLALRDQEDKRRKPAGATAAYLYAFVGATPPPDLTQWQFKGGSSKSDPQVLVEDSVAAGTPVWFTALYVNGKLQPGPACAPVKTHVNFEGMNNVSNAA